MNELALKYGCNPNQKPSRIYMEDGSDLPVTVLNGKPGYINFLDALNSIQLVKELKEATGLPARREPRLREQCFGKYEGTPRDGEEFRISKTHFADRYSGGESMMQLAQRIYNLLDELRQDENKTYLLVAHNGIARVVESYFHDMTNEDYAAAGIKNCELVEYRFE